MRPVQGGAGGKAMPTGASPSSRGGQTRAWRRSALPVCSPSRGVVADTPLGWGGGPFTCWALPRPRPGDPELSPKDRSHSHSDPWAG